MPNPALKRLESPYLKCRGGYNHAGDDCPPPPRRQTRPNKPGTWQVWMRCDRCEALRLDQVNRRTGALEGRTYWLPEGYSSPDLRGLQRPAYRLELARRRNNGSKL